MTEETEVNTETQEQSEQSEQPNTCFLVSSDVMQLIFNVLGEQKLKDAGGLYVQLLQTPRIETANLQKALDSWQNNNEENKGDK